MIETVFGGNKLLSTRRRHGEPCVVLWAGEREGMRRSVFVPAEVCSKTVVPSEGSGES